MNRARQLTAVKHEPMGDEASVTDANAQAAVKRNKDLAEPSKDKELVGLWFELNKHPWTTLAIVPTSYAHSAEKWAERLADVGKLHLMQPVHLIYACGLELINAQEIIDQMHLKAQTGKVIVLCDNLLDNVAATPLVRAADHSLLVVRLGQDDIVTAQKIVSIVGRHHVLGVATVDPDL
jgi:hypothetical protein